MVRARSPAELAVGDAFVAIMGLLPFDEVHLKIECYSAGGSIKTKTAREMVEALERTGEITQGLSLIESSSGNLGIALSIMAAERGYRFTCVSDPNISGHAVKLMRAYGAEVVIVRETDANGGFLESRLSYIRSRLEREPDLVWLNQYRHPANPLAHERFTGPELLSAFERIDYLFIGAGTTGTLNGVSRAVRRKLPGVEIVAVDAQGSVTFGAPPSRRHIPGLGTSRRPEIASEDAYDRLQLVSEADAILMCRQLAARGLLVGGSTGSVLAAVSIMRDELKKGSCVVAISADMGDRYLDTIYDDDWVEERFPGLVAHCGRALRESTINWGRDGCHD